MFRHKTLGGAKITAQDALKIYEDRRETRTIATEYGVHPDTIRNIWSKRSWKQIHAAHFENR